MNLFPLDLKGVCGSNWNLPEMEHVVQWLRCRAGLLAQGCAPQAEPKGVCLLCAVRGFHTEMQMDAYRGAQQSWYRPPSPSTSHFFCMALSSDKLAHEEAVGQYCPQQNLLLVESRLAGRVSSPLTSSCYLADLTRDWDQFLGDFRMVMRPSFPHPIWSLCPKHPLH